MKIKYQDKILGKWLKSEMLFFINEKYPEVKYITTSNATKNEAMFSINYRMGFKVQQKKKTYKIKITELEKRIAEIESN